MYFSCWKITLESSGLAASENNPHNTLYTNYLISYTSTVFSIFFSWNTQSFFDKKIAINNIFLTYQLNLYWKCCLTFLRYWFLVTFPLFKGIIRSCFLACQIALFSIPPITSATDLLSSVFYHYCCKNVLCYLVEFKNQISWNEKNHWSVGLTGYCHPIKRRICWGYRQTTFSPITLRRMPFHCVISWKESAGPILSTISQSSAKLLTLSRELCRLLGKVVVGRWSFWQGIMSATGALESITCIPRQMSILPGRRNLPSGPNGFPSCRCPASMGWIFRKYSGT